MVTPVPQNNLTMSVRPRPWLDLYTPFSQQGQHSRRPTATSIATSDSGWNLLSLPPEVLFSVFSMLEEEQLGTLAQVCTELLSHAYDPRHWRRIALAKWPAESRLQLERMLYSYRTWRLLCILRPHLRTNGIYVVRHQFAKTTSKAACGEPQAPVFLVTYHRFLRFYTNGVVVSLVTPELPHLAVRRVRRNWSPVPSERDKTSPIIGRYEFDELNARVVVTLPMGNPQFPAMRSGTIYMHMTLSSTKSGAFDRLFVTDHYAIMDHDGGDLVSYRAHGLDATPFRFIGIWQFRSAVYREFPRDDDFHLAQWFEMKRTEKSFRK